MKIYNKEKTQILDNPDFKKGYLKQDKIVVKTIPATEEVQEQFHYVTIKEYENGGKDVEKVIDVEYQPAKPETYEYEDIQVYILYTEEELTQKEIYELEARLKELSQDIIQMKCGADFGTRIDDEGNEISIADERVAEFREKHNRLRFLKGKEPRVYEV